MNKTKSFDIPKQLIWKAYLRVKQNGGAAGVDEVSLKEFERNLKDNLYKLWNRMSSGSYFPPPVKLVLIPKGDGGKRPLGIPTVADRIAQTAVTLLLGPVLEPCFDVDSYGYRRNKSAHQAVGQARQRCWEYKWAIDLDIKGFFDNLDHELVLRALAKRTPVPWLTFYVERWLTACVHLSDGTLMKRDRGTPQGGVVSPLLANLLLHYAFDRWMRKNHEGVLFERYADDILVHCHTQAQAKELLKEIEDRLKACGLELNQHKTRIVHCGTTHTDKDFPYQSFDFLGFTFRKRLAQSKIGKRFVGFLPAMSNQAKQHVRSTIKQLRIHRQIHHTLASLANWLNPMVRGWSNYYGRFYRSEVVKPLLQVEIYVLRWVRSKFRKKTGLLSTRCAMSYLDKVRKHNPKLFAHWEYGCWTLSAR